ncbi:MAG: hypothetical protein ACRDTG_19840, partial [Pseudonocardiaceae bacterium]
LPPQRGRPPESHPREARPTMLGILRRLVISSRDQLITSGRVRMRQLICVGCRRRTWVVVGPPRCPDCTQGTPPKRTRANPR